MSVCSWCWIFVVFSCFWLLLGFFLFFFEQKRKIVLHFLLEKFSKRIYWGNVCANSAFGHSTLSRKFLNAKMNKSWLHSPHLLFRCLFIWIRMFSFHNLLKCPKDDVRRIGNSMSGFFSQLRSVKMSPKNCIFHDSCKKSWESWIISLSRVFISSVDALWGSWNNKIPSLSYWVEYEKETADGLCR